MGLAEILARKKAAALLPKPTVEMYVALYERNPRLLYINYYENYQLLIDWLGSPVPDKSEGYISPILMSYEIQQMAKLLDVSQYAIYSVALRNARMTEK